MMEMKTGISRPIYLSRWWLRVRQCEPVSYPDGSTGASAEYYIPAWAWPFELMHRAIFGRARLIG